MILPMNSQCFYLLQNLCMPPCLRAFDGCRMLLAVDQDKGKIYHDKHHVRSYESLPVGQEVVCQNMKNRKWDRMGVIIEANTHRQFKVKMLGSGRISLRNRIHLKPLLHITSHASNL